MKNNTKGLVNEGCGNKMKKNEKHLVLLRSINGRVQL
jgi:hypothetical protein